MMTSLSWAVEVAVTASIPTASEAGSPGKFTLTATPAPAASMTVLVSITGTAGNTTDYAAIQTSITMPMTGIAEVALTPVDDAIPEGNETVIMTVLPGGAYTVSATNAVATVTIIDNEPVLTVSTLVHGSETATNGSFRIINASLSATPVTVTYSVAGTATAGDDYQSLSGTVTLLAGTSQVDIPVTIIDDALEENDETILLTLTSNPSNYALGATTNATMTVADNEPVITVAANQGASETGPTIGSFVLTASRAPTANLSVVFTLEGTATEGADFVAISHLATIAAGTLTTTVTITPIDDTVGDAAETVVLRISDNPAYHITATPTATLTIQDNEPVVTVISAANAAEPGTNGAFTFQSDRTVTSDVTMTYTVSGTAVASSDYAALSGSATMLSGTNSVTIPVVVLDDLVAEVPETVTLALSSQSAYSLGPQASATLTLVDNEPVISLVAGSNGSEPGNAGSFTVQADRILTSPLTVTFTVGGTATSGSDYTVLGTSVVIPSGTDLVTIPVLVLDDQVVESLETVTMTLTSQGTYTLGTSKTASVTIADDEIALSASTFQNATESGTLGIFRLTGSSPINRVVTIGYTLTGTAVNGTDYLALSGSVVLPANAASVDVVVTPIDDLLSEDVETIILTLANDPGYRIGTAAASMTLTDNEASISVAVDSNAAEPGTNGQFRITATVAQAQPTTIRFSISGTATSSRDFTALGTSTTLAAGVTSVLVSVLPTDDSEVEPTETITLTLTDDPAYRVATRTATMTLTDDEPTVSLQAVTNAAEPATQGAFKVSYAGPALSRPVIISWTMSGTATSGADYAALGQTVTIPAGQTNLEVPVLVLDDQVAEDTKTITATLQPGSGYAVSATASATVLIADDEPVVTVTATRNAEEGGSDGTFTIAAPTALSAPLTVFYSLSGTSAGTADYVAIPSFATISAGSDAVTVTVTAVDDSLVEGSESLTLTLTERPAYHLGATIAATLTIADNEPEFAIEIVTQPSEAGTVGSLRLSLTGPARPAPITVALGISGTATSGIDFTVPDLAPVLPAGQTQMTLTLTALDDANKDPNETVIITVLPGPAYRVASGRGTATLTIVDSTPTVSISAASSPAEPATAGGFLVSYSGPVLQRAISVLIQMTGTAITGTDYQAVPTTVTIPVGTNQAFLAITPIDDEVRDPSETVIATILASNAYVLGTASATLTLQDDDPHPTKIVNEPDEIVTGTGQVWSHTILIDKGESLNVSGITAVISNAPGNLSAPAWVHVGTLEVRSSTRVAIPLRGTVTGNGVAHFRVAITAGGETSAQDFLLIILTGGGNG